LMFRKTKPLLIDKMIKRKLMFSNLMILLISHQ
jgi:hypothetical protein